MKLYTFSVQPAQAGTPLNALARKALPQVPERCLRTAFDQRDVKMNGVRVPRDTLAQAGAEIKIYLSDDCPTQSPEILYEDAQLLVVQKPVGISCEVDAHGGLTLGEWLMQQEGKRFTQTPMPCHRLDNQTDGLLLMAKDPSALLYMQQAFRERQVHKKYVCLVRGTPEPPEAMRTAYLCKDAQRARVQVHETPSPGALTIRTGYRVLSAGEIARLEITLLTGRTHQIRAHMAFLGHPLLGDDLYGDRAFNRAHHARRLMLTATELTFSVEGAFAYLNAMHFQIQPKF